MVEEKATIGEKQIIALYQAGYSQNDIVSKYQVSVHKTREILKRANFDTRSYRSLNETMKKVIFTLVKAGVYYLGVERVTDISFHAIRQYILHQLPIEDRKSVPPKAQDYNPAKLRNLNQLFSAFIAGESFCSLVDRHCLSEEDIIRFYLALDDDTLAAHRDSLKSLILSDIEDGLNQTFIAKKRMISRSIVKKISAS